MGHNDLPPEFAHLFGGGGGFGGPGMRMSFSSMGPGGFTVHSSGGGNPFF